LERQLCYWRERLRGAPPVLELPTDRERPAVQSFRGASHTFELPRELGEALKALSQQESVTPFMTLLTAYKALLLHLTGQQDIVVGVDIAGRARVELEGLIGFFVNILAMRTDLSGDPSFRGLLRRVRETALGAYAHQDLPFERLVEELRPGRSLGGMPLARTIFSFRNAPQAELKLLALTLRPFGEGAEKAKRDLTLFMSEEEGRLVGVWNYNSELFRAESVGRISEQFERLLVEFTARPEARLGDALKLLAEAEKDRAAVNKKERKDLKLKQLINVAPKPVSLAQASLVLTERLPEGKALPLVVRPALDDVDLAEWARDRREFVEARLLEHGAILFRGFGLDTPPTFERFALALCPELFEEYGDLPREGLGGRVYGSTPYPADRAILFHNESSHLDRWPMKIWFGCMRAAEQGGETPLVDCREVYRLLDPAIRQRFTDKHLMYLRNYVEGLDVSWQEFFHTNDRGVVEAECRRTGTAFEWTAGGGLRTRQMRRAVARHPRTGEEVFFNQIQAHHVSCLEPTTRTSLLSLLGEDSLPRNVYYGDGTPIEDSVVDEICGLYRQVAVNFLWQEGDVLMLDNMLTAHGRNPYKGERKIVVAMGEMATNQGL
jgi:alpha-ketoglutarate-dependent taurine dioxygenase